MEKNEKISYEEALRILSVAEVRVLELVERGNTNKEGARKLGNSSRTIQTHRNNICKKLGVKGRLGLIKWLWRVRNGKNEE